MIIDDNIMYSIYILNKMVGLGNVSRRVAYFRFI